MFTPAALLVLALQTSSPPPSECWIGSVGSGRTFRRAVVELGASPPTLTILQRTWNAQPLAELRDDSNGLVFTIAGTPVRFEGRRTSGIAINGALVPQPGAEPRPMALRRGDGLPDRAQKVLLGYWAGQLTGSGFPARVVLRFHSATCGTTHLLLDSPDQATNSLPATALVVRGDSVTFAFAYLDATFQGTIDSSGTRLTGRWRQQGLEMTLDATRSDSVGANRRPQDPLPPFPYRAEEVRYENNGVRFAGTLTIPAGTGPHPAMLLLSGSGAQDRDETVAGHRPFLVLADALTRAGIAVLRVDDRGVGGSSGSITEATIDDNASDASAALRVLSARTDIDPTRIGLLGHSEGGWLAPLVVDRDSVVQFVVMLAGPAVRGDSLMFAQQRAIGRATGVPDEVIEARRLMTGIVVRILNEERVDALAQQRIDSAMSSVRARAQGRWRVVLDSLYGQGRAAELESSWSVMRTPWLRHLMTFDPRPHLSRLRIPLLALYAERDLQVPSQLNADALRNALHGTGSDVTIAIMPGLNHLFQHAQTGLPDEYATIDETIASEVLQTIVDWVRERVSRVGRDRRGPGG